MDLQNLIAQIWPRVRKHHLVPGLPSPEMVESNEAVAMQMRDKQIVLSRAHCEALAEAMPA